MNIMLLPNRMEVDRVIAEDFIEYLVVSGNFNDHTDWYFLYVGMINYRKDMAWSFLQDSWIHPNVL